MAGGPEVSRAARAQLKKYVESITCFRLNSPEGSKGEVRGEQGGNGHGERSGFTKDPCSWTVLLMECWATPHRGQAEPDGLADTGLRD